MMNMHRSHSALVLHTLIMLIPLSLTAESNSTGTTAKEAKLQIGMDAPLFEATALDGQNTSLEDFKGKVTVVVFWATWCGPCKPLLTLLSECYREYHLDGFDVIAFSLDEDKDTLSSFLGKAQYPWRQNVCLGDVEHTICRMYCVSALPTVYLLGRKGKIRTNTLRVHDEREGISSAPSPQDIISALLFSDARPERAPSKGAVEGVVIRNGELVGISANLKLIDDKSKQTFAINKANAIGSFAFHDVVPGTYRLELINGSMSSKMGQLSLTKKVNVLEDVQWHNFQIEDGSSTIKCSRGDSYVMWLRQELLHNHATVEYAQYLIQERLPNGKHVKRNEYMFTGLEPGKYEYRVQWLRGNVVYVDGGQLRIKADETANIEAKLPTGRCKITGKLMGIRKELYDPILFVRHAGAGPIEYSRYYEMGTWDTVFMVRDRDIAKSGTFTCDGLPTGNYVVTVAQLQDRQYGIPVQQTSQAVNLHSDAPEIFISLDLTTDR